jgi:hypothetical protein
VRRGEEDVRGGTFGETGVEKGDGERTRGRRRGDGLLERTATGERADGLVEGAS